MEEKWLEKSRKIIELTDVPSCKFIIDSIADEHKAIDEYLDQSEKSDDQVIKEIFHSIATDEMKHLRLLNDLKNKFKCNSDGNQEVKRLTYIFPNECISKECKQIVGNTSKIVERKYPKPIYLTFQVKDREPKGLSDLTETVEIAEQILQDVETETISKQKGIQRLNALYTNIKKSHIGNFTSEKDKEIAFDLLDDFKAKILGE